MKKQLNLSSNSHNQDVEIEFKAELKKSKSELETTVTELEKIKHEKIYLKSQISTEETEKNSLNTRISFFEKSISRLEK
jgi:hypothetical protein